MNRQLRDWLRLLCLAALTAAGLARAQRVESLGAPVRKYLRVNTPRVILTHVQVIDGTGGIPLADRNVTIANGKITAIEAGADVTPVDGTTVLELKGHTVIPGIVGMHDHLFAYVRPDLAPDLSFEAPAMFVQMTFSAPRLYLANGVTTLRTTGSIAPDADLRLKQPSSEARSPAHIWTSPARTSMVRAIPTSRSTS